MTQYNFIKSKKNIYIYIYNINARCKCNQINKW